VLPGLLATKSYDFKTKKVNTATAMTPQGITIAGKYILLTAYDGEHDHKVIVNTDAPSLIIYTGNGFDHTGKYTSDFGQYAGITFEAQIQPAEGNDLGRITLLPNFFN